MSLAVTVRKTSSWEGTFGRVHPQQGLVAVLGAWAGHPVAADEVHAGDGVTLRGQASAGLGEPVTLRSDSHIPGQGQGCRVRRSGLLLATAGLGVDGEVRAGS